MPTLLVDGAPATHVALAPDDAALWTGHAVFETLRTYARRPFRLDVHLDRLDASARWMGLASVDRDVVTAEIATVTADIAGEAKVNVLLTAGGRRVVKAEPLDRSRVGAPLRIVTRPWTPTPWLPGRVKHTSRAGWTLAARGADEVLWVDPSGCWTEANRSNVFVVRDGVLLTPPDDGSILQGVTRDCLCEAARAVGITIVEGPVRAGPCDELYLCSTLKELAPVVEVDGVARPAGGPVGARLAVAFRDRFPEVAVPLG